jgi:anti-sigma factor RsiW
LMMGSLLSTWNLDQEFSVSKQKNLIVNNNTVIVPKGETVKGDVVVRNGKLKIEGEIQGNVTVINGEKYMASAGHVTGQIEEVNQAFDWIWYQIKKTAYEVIDIFEEPKTE